MGDIVMCVGGSAPAPAPKLPEAPTPPAQSATSVDTDRRRRIASNSDTILTSSSGVTANAPLQQKTLLGS